MESSVQRYINLTIVFDNAKCNSYLLNVINYNQFVLWTARCCVLFFIFYSFVGLIKLIEIILISIEQIMSKNQLWNNKTFANITLIAFGLNSFEILFTILELFNNRINTISQSGPNLIIGSSLFNLLIIISISIYIAPSSSSNLRIKNNTVFSYSFLFAIFYMIWLVFILKVITPNQIDLWESVVTVFFYPKFVCIILFIDSYFVNDISDTVQLRKFQRNVDKVNKFIKVLDKHTLLSEDQKLNLIEYYIARTMQHSQLFYRIHSISNLTGSKHLAISSHLKEIFKSLEYMLNPKRIALSDYFNNNDNNNDESDSDYCIHSNTNLKPSSVLVLNKLNDNLISYVTFSSLVYLIRPMCLKCQIELNRYGNLDSTIWIRLNTLDGTMLAGQDYKALNDYEVKFKPGEDSIKLSLLISAQMSSQIGNNFFIHMKPHENTLNLVKLNSINYCTVIVSNSHKELQSVEIIEFLETIYQIDTDESNYVLLKLIRDHIYRDDDKEVVIELVSDILYDSSKITLHREIKFSQYEKEKLVAFEIPKKLKKDHICLKLISISNEVKVGLRNTAYIFIQKKKNSKIKLDLKKLQSKKNEIFKFHRTSWKDQFKNAVNVNNGECSENISTLDHILHSIAFFWKVLFSIIIPPCLIGNGWPSFIVSICLSGGLTLLNVNLFNLFECFFGLNSSFLTLNVIPILLGIPKIAFSIMSVLKEKSGDNSIGFIPTSTIVNILIGLGIPWLIETIYWNSKGLPLVLRSDQFFPQLIWLIICYILCFILLLVRRKFRIFGFGELGGSVISKFLSAYFLTICWILFVSFNFLQNFNLIK